MTAYYTFANLPLLDKQNKIMNDFEPATVFPLDNPEVVEALRLINKVEGKLENFTEEDITTWLGLSNKAIKTALELLNSVSNSNIDSEAKEARSYFHVASQNGWNDDIDDLDDSEVIELYRQAMRYENTKLEQEGEYNVI